MLNTGDLMSMLSSGSTGPGIWDFQHIFAESQGSVADNKVHCSYFA